jgi:hypothetical protein
MAILKRQRARKARKIVKALGLAYGPAIRLAKHLERQTWLPGPGEIEGLEVKTPVYCECCGPATDDATLHGPRGELHISDLKSL